MTSQSSHDDTVEQVVRALNLTNALREAGLTDDMIAKIIAEPDVASTGVASLLANAGDLEQMPQGDPAAEASVSRIGADAPVGQLFDTRTSNILLRKGIEVVGDLASYTETEVMLFHNFGEKTLARILQAMADANVTFRPPYPRY
jgi:DNA-directed RNA polymerase alpha subunit